jgi:hypothetical protein
VDLRSGTRPPIAETASRSLSSGRAKRGPVGSQRHLKEPSLRGAERRSNLDVRGAEGNHSFGSDHQSHGASQSDRLGVHCRAGRNRTALFAAQPRRRSASQKAKFWDRVFTYPICLSDFDGTRSEVAWLLFVVRGAWLDAAEYYRP